MRHTSLFLWMVALCFTWHGEAAYGQLQISVTTGFIEPLPVSVVGFTVSDAIDASEGAIDPDADALPDTAATSLSTPEAQNRALAATIPAIIRADLERSGLFRPIDPLAFLVDSVDFGTVPDFSNWRPLGGSALLYGDIRRDQNAPEGSVDRLELRFHLWDVFAQRYIMGRRFTFDRVDHRQIAHRIADNIYQALTGESPYFNTRLLYIEGIGDARRLAIMDSDGANLRYLPSGEGVPLTPRFSPNQQSITYLALSDKALRVFLYRLDTGIRENLGLEGLSFAPRFAPLQQSVVFSYAKPDEPANVDIWTMNLISRRFERLTRHPAIDVSPSFSPDGTQIAFSADRGGTQQIYIMDADGENIERITFEEGRFGTPVWSPRGDLIAFTRQTGNKFAIGVMRTDGTAMRILDERWHVEGPTWSPNGRVLVYYSEYPSDSGVYGQLHSVDITGYNKRDIPTPGSASDPAWSPLLDN
ncbi:MAG: Tol-Pal system protein TolB [Alphaproteobacteria bacterium]|nr:Tol-Pal system protein TolB [Alphaproteobacteria bacterium]